MTPSVKRRGRAAVRALGPLFCALLLLGAPRAAGAEPAVTAILGAFDEEIARIREAVAMPESLRVLGIPVLTGRIEGRRVVVAGTGVGKVNAAAAAALVIERFHPREVLFTGIAGGLAPHLAPGDVVLGARVAHHDLVAAAADSVRPIAVRNPATGERNPIYFAADPHLLEIARREAAPLLLSPVPGSPGGRRPAVVEGTIATGDAFVASPALREQIRARLGADAVEMEGAAVAQICYQNRVPCLVVRSLSDRAGELAEEEIERFYKIAARNSASLVVAIIRGIAGEAKAARPRDPAPVVAPR